MGIRGLRKWALLLTFWVALQTRLVRASPITGDTVSGNFTATGSADIQGTTLSLGTNSATSDPGALTFYTDGTTSYVDFEASRSANVWRWWQSPGGTPQLQMSLDNSDILTIYNTSGAGIVLNPSSTSTIAGSLTVSGTDNEMPNQTLVNSHSVLTEGLGDSRYAPFSSVTSGSGTWDSITGPTTALNGGTATGPFSFAEGTGSTAGDLSDVALGYHDTASSVYDFASGYYSSASGPGSTAMGSHATASGDYCTALGLYTTATYYADTAMGYGSNATGAYSTAIGFGNTASGPFSAGVGGGFSLASGSYSLVSGLDDTASGYFSRALGNHVTASGYSSTGIGFYTTAHAAYSTVVGTYNVGGGSLTTWVATDPLFEVGNGGNTTYGGNPAINGTSDAFVVYKNGNAAVQGTVTTGGGIAAGGVITAQPGGDIPMYTGN